MQFNQKKLLDKRVRINGKQRWVRGEGISNSLNFERGQPPAGIYYYKIFFRLIKCNPKNNFQVSAE